MGPLKPDTCCSPALLPVNKGGKLEAINLYLTKQSERKAPGTAGGGCRKGTKVIFNFYSVASWNYFQGLEDAAKWLGNYIQTRQKKDSCSPRVSMIFWWTFWYEMQSRAYFGLFYNLVSINCECYILKCNTWQEHMYRQYSHDFTPQIWCHCCQQTNFPVNKWEHAVQ